MHYIKISNLLKLIHHLFPYTFKSNRASSKTKRLIQYIFTIIFQPFEIFNFYVIKINLLDHFSLVSRVIRSF